MKVKFFLASALICCAAVYANAADNLGDMFSNGSGNAEIRALSFSRNYDSSKQDLGENAIGGMFHFKTDELHGVFLGVGFYTSNDMNSDGDKGNYDLLQSTATDKHKSFTKMGEYYVGGNWFNTTVKYGAQEINTPYLNGYDVRMLPITYKGLSIVNKSITNLQASLYYLTDSMNRTSTDFTDISSSFSSKLDDNPLLAAGIKYSLNLADSTAIVPQAWYYTVSDGFEFTYLNTEFSTKAGDFKFILTPSYLQQKAIGDKEGGDLDTDQYGAVGTVKAYNAFMSLYYAKTGDDNLAIPYGHSRIITQQVLAATRANEKAYGAKAGYDFSALGAKGLSFSVFYAKYDTPDSGASATFDAHETDYDLIYKVPFKQVKGLTLRARYAQIDEDKDHGGVDQTDTRLYAIYDFSFGGQTSKK